MSASELQSLQSKFHSIQQIDPSFSLDRILDRVVKNKAIVDAAKPAWKNLYSLLGRGAYIYLDIEDGRIYIELYDDREITIDEYNIKVSGAGYDIETGEETLDIFRALVAMYDIHTDVDYWVKQTSYQHYI